MELFLIRHPAPCDVRGRCYGRLDLTVSASTLDATTRELRRRIPRTTWRDAAIYTSPLTRCVSLARALTPNPVIDPDLIEMDFGAWEGLAWNAVAREQLDAWANDIWDYRPGGAENACDVAQRWQRCLRRLQGTDAEVVIVVTHAGVIRVALAAARGADLAVVAQQPIEFGSVHTLGVTA